MKWCRWWWESRELGGDPAYGIVTKTLRWGSGGEGVSWSHLQHLTNVPVFFIRVNENTNFIKKSNKSS